MILILCILLNILLSYIDSRIFAKSLYVSHGFNGALYITLIIVFHKSYTIDLIYLMLRLIFFNIPLSLFRNLAWNYVSPKRKSIVDKAAFFIWGYKGTYMYISYLIITSILICYEIFINHTTFSIYTATRF